MQYCPKCKIEYEDHVKECADCGVPLVDDLTVHTFMQNLVRVKKGDAPRMLEYLEYSGFEKIETEEDAETVLIKIAQEDYEKALQYMKVYIHENMEEDSTEDYYLDEYTLEEVDTTATVSDMKSTIYTFGVLGVALLVLDALNYLDIITIAGFNKSMLTVVLGVLGIGFVGVAIKTAKDLGGAAEKGNAKEELIAGMIEGYKNKYPLGNFYRSHKIKKDQVDDGALYFMIFDVLKKEVRKMYPDEADTIINTVVERIYDELEAL